MYSRETELRNLRSNDAYKLAVILDHNQCWKKLMEVIPKELGSIDITEKPKYNNDDIRLIECAIQRPGESRLYSQILFDEWGTSGKKHERPTLGVLLQLLVRAELFRAADFVAMNFLNEPPPDRPINGPAAKIDISLSDEIFADIKDIVNDSSFYPGTASLLHNANFANSLADNNKDYCTKYHVVEKNVVIMPTPPPRTLRHLQLKQQNPQQQNELYAKSIGINRDEIVEKNYTVFEKMNNAMLAADGLTSENIPECSTLLADDDTSNTDFHHIHSNSVSNYISEAPIPMISILAPQTTSNDNISTNISRNSDNFSKVMITDNEMLPVISALNIESTRNTVATSSAIITQHEVEKCNEGGGFEDGNSQSSSSSNESFDNENRVISNKQNNCGSDDDDDDDADDAEDDNICIPNLSILERRSSNNDSSLTTVTDNDFDFNDCSSNSENIPCLSALKP